MVSSLVQSPFTDEQLKQGLKPGDNLPEATENCHHPDKGKIVALTLRRWGFHHGISVSSSFCCLLGILALL